MIIPVDTIECFFWIFEDLVCLLPLEEKRDLYDCQVVGWDVCQEPVQGPVVIHRIITILDPENEANESCDCQQKQRD